MNVMERRREIGVMRSIGAPTGTLLWTYLLEGLLLGLLGWAIGFAAGGPASERLVALLNERLIPVEYDLPQALIAATLLLVALVAFFSSIGPALAAARMRVADILRYA
jgi:ABC-type lipoprotein release transport system permease subunit